MPLEQVRERLRDKPVQWISGHFDPLLAQHVRRLREVATSGHTLVVVVTNPAQPLLAQRARAELVAALSMVAYVVLGDADSADDSGITDRFIEHVLARHGEGGAG
jgi:bifunctional ADP-heptose synthase (sugar kinase/adenylyltransferase)